MTSFFAVVVSALLVVQQSLAFAPTNILLLRQAPSSSSSSLIVRYAGGFEWEDPTESFDQGVDNPYKNPDLMNSEEGLKIDPARLLGPRLNGSNLYFIGMMGSGKSKVGDAVARRKY